MEGPWPTTSKVDCSKSATAACSARAGSARIPTTAPATRSSPGTSTRATSTDVDVSGRTIALLAHVPGNILQGNWKAAVYLDDGVEPGAGGRADLGVYTGQAGRPGRRPREARRRGRVGREGADRVRGARRPRARSRSARRPAPSSSPIPNATARRRRCATPSSRRCRARRSSSASRRATGRTNAKLGIDLDLKGHNALQSTFVFHALTRAGTRAAAARERPVTTRPIARGRPRRDARASAQAATAALLVAVALAGVGARSCWWSASP